jgi:NAD(P)-dependent dehydrogenase (short-subunit alcohol dehydrogenase family)
MSSQSTQNMLDRQVVVVTGGAGLLGKAMVAGIATCGGIAIAADINLDAAAEFVAGLNGMVGGSAEPAMIDITSQSSIAALIGDVLKRHGRIDAVVNNAYPRNKNYGRRLEEVTYQDFCENVDVHLGGYFLVAQQFCMAFKAQGHGNLINMSSIYGSMTPRFNVYQGTTMTTPVEYAAIKAAIEHLTRYFAQYFKGYGIRVNCLSPGGILAAQPADFVAAYNSYCASKGMLGAEDIVGALLFLLSDQSRYMTGQNLMVDDGFSL